MILASLAAAALAGVVEVMPVRGPDLTSMDATRTALVVVWDGGASDVEILQKGKWKVIARGVTSPYTTDPLPLASWLRVVGPQGVTGVDAPDGVWTPDDFAAWSGPGLQGAVVGGLASVGDALWIATQGGGLTLWDGQRFRDVDRRDGLLSSMVYSVALDGADRWVGHALGATRIAGDGHLTHWWIDRGAWDVLPGDRGGAWAASRAGVVRLDERGTSMMIADPSCQNLLAHPDHQAVAVCGTRGVRVIDGEPVVGLDVETAPVGLVGRADGVWVARTDRLEMFVKGERTPWWQAPPLASLTSLVRLGKSMLASATTPGGSPGFRVTETGVVALRPADGVPTAHGLTTAPGPRDDRAWLGTDRGVALIQESGTGTPLPLAPLPAGVAVNDVALWQDRDDRGVGVASDLGLVWFGDGRPAGWSALVAATGPARAIVQDSADGWWGVGQTAAFRLADGQLTRWELDGAAIRAVAVGTSVAIATDAGVRFWVPGARMLSPVQPVDAPIEDLVATADGTLWMAGRDRVVALAAGDVRTWADLPPVFDLAVGGDGVWVATSKGVLRIDPHNPDPQRTDLRQDRLIGVGVAAGRLHLLDADGQLYRADPDGIHALSLGVHAHINGKAQLVGDDSGVWVATSGGMFRVTPVDGLAPLDP